MDLICKQERCYGCGLCANLCSVHAISMKEDEFTGHFHPIIDNRLCIDCKKCRNQCPANHAPVFHPTIKAYAAWRKDPRQQIGSSSGGVAAALYEVALKKGWTIVGTSMDGVCKVSTRVTETVDFIEQFKGSKYVQADTRDVFRTISEKVQSGARVLFIGTPCQCEAARSAVGKKQDFLLTIDLVCHGVPSQKLLRDYVLWIEKKKKKKIDSISFRSDWGVEMQMFAKGQTIWKRRMYWDYYLDLFNSGYITNSACFTCPYAGEKRASDLTIGDFWGIGKTVPFDSPKRKVSLIAVNTNKGACFLNECTSLSFCEREWAEAVAGNSQLQAPIQKSEQYDLFWDQYNEAGFDAAVRATVYDKVTKRFLKEYPILSAKSSIKAILKKLLIKT